MKRNYAPTPGSEEREGWDKCLDTPPKQRKAALKGVVRSMDEPGRRRWAKGWMDAWDTFGMASFSEIKRRMKGGKSIKESRLRRRGYLDEYHAGGQTHDQKYVGRLDPDQEELFDTIALMAENEGDAYRKRDAKMAFELAKKEYMRSHLTDLRANFRAIAKPVMQYLQDRWAREKREMGR